MGLRQKRLILTGIIFFSLLLAVVIPFSPFSFGATNDTFTVTLTIGNIGPNITWVESGLSVAPNIGTSRNVFISFNASDPDGYTNLDNTTAQVIISYGNEQARTSAFCRVNDTYDNTTTFNCSVTLWYFDVGANWIINASISDQSASYIENTTETIQIQDLTAVQLDRSSMAFSASIGQNMVASGNNPLGVDNLGNVNISLINVTGFDLNKTGSAETVTAESFMINATGGATLVSMSNTSRVTIPSAVVPRDLAVFAENESLFLYVNVSGALTAGAFSSMHDWVVDVS